VVNCYQILNIPNFSDKKTVRKAYIGLAKTLHPDVGAGSDAEQFKLVSKAYDTLTDDQTKQYHDYKLKQALSMPVDFAIPKPKQARRDRYRPATSPEEIRARQMRRARMKMNHDVSFYRQKDAKLSYTHRVLGWGMLLLLGWSQIYSRWFVNYDSYDHIIGFSARIAFLLGCAKFYADLYEKLRYQFIKTRKGPNFDKRSIAIAATVLIIGIVSLPVLNHYRKSYHLNHYGKYAVVDFSFIDADRINVVFKPMGMENSISKYMTLPSEAIYDKAQRWVLVRFSRANPKIVEVVTRENYSEDYLPAPLN